MSNAIGGRFTSESPTFTSSIISTRAKNTHLVDMVHLADLAHPFYLLHFFHFAQPINLIVLLFYLHLVVHLLFISYSSSSSSAKSSNGSSSNYH